MNSVLSIKSFLSTDIRGIISLICIEILFDDCYYKGLIIGFIEPTILKDFRI